MGYEGARLEVNTARFALLVRASASRTGSGIQGRSQPNGTAAAIYRKSASGT